MPKIIAALLAVFICLSGLPATAATTGVVRGKVTLSGSPQPGVAITLQGEGSRLNTSSDATGNFIFAQVPFGTYTLTAAGAGGTYSQSIWVASDQVLTLSVALGALKTIASLNVSSRAGASGTPVSQNSINRRQLGVLPSNNSLNGIIATVPGIVKFSYNEPVAHGFHGVTYEIDGAPLPQGTSSNFAEIIDPKSIDSLEIFTGAMPAEYGGSRQGAVINIISSRASDLTVPYQGVLTLGTGNYGQNTLSFDSALKTGRTEVFFNANSQRSVRGLDAPTFDAIHDDASQSDQFLRTITTFNERQSLGFDFSNQLAQFQIPINTDPANIYDPHFSTPSTGDVQREYDRYASLNFTSVSKDGNGIFQVIPWLRYTRVAYDGALGADVLGLTNLGPGYQTDIGLRQNRAANYAGLRFSQFRVTGKHAIKVGADVSREMFNASQTFACYDPSCSTVVNSYPVPPPAGGYTAFSSTQDQAGTQAGIYAQDKWAPSQKLSVSYGVRWDRSTGYTSGNQISPRIGVNYAPDERNVLHAYFARFYAAPQLEDVRAACVVLQGCPAVPRYDLKPETDAYSEIGFAHTFSLHFNGYVNVWQRYASNVLDTTQLLNTPLFAVFNNAIGRAHGVELRLQGTLTNTDSWFLSGGWSSAQAAGVSGSTFLFPPNASASGNLVSQLAPEDHDQKGTLEAAFTHRFGDHKAFFTTLQTEYGSGYPVAFQGVINGNTVAFDGRLPSHTSLDWSLGREAGRNGNGSLGFDLTVNNLLNDKYPIKIANGFNTTQISQGRTVLLRLSAPF